jgi:hypothetical protein
MLRTSVICDLRFLPDEVAQAMLQRVRAVTSAGTAAFGQVGPMISMRLRTRTAGGTARWQAASRHLVPRDTA